MYSMVLMMAMSTSPEAVAFGKRNNCNGCTGGTSCSGMVVPAPASCGGGCSGGESCDGGKRKLFGGNGLFGGGGGGGLFKKHKGCSGGEGCNGGCTGGESCHGGCHGSYPVYVIPAPAPCCGEPAPAPAPCCGDAPSVHIHTQPIIGSAPIVYEPLQKEPMKKEPMKDKQ